MKRYCVKFTRYDDDRDEEFYYWDKQEALSQFNFYQEYR